MAFPGLKKFASIKGWKIEKNTAYGEENGYLFTLADGQGFKMFLSPLPLTDDHTKNEILDYLNKNKDILEFNNCRFENAVLIVEFREAFISTKVEVLDKLVMELAAFLKSKEVNGKGHCIFCGHSGADEIIYVDNIMYSAHEQCYSHQVAKAEEVVKEFKTEDKNYLRGFMGALIGGVVSSIPWVLVQLYFEKMAIALAFLIGLGALKGYKMFKGKFGDGTRWVIVLCTFISVVLAQFGIIAIEMIQHNIKLSVSNFVEVLTDPVKASYFNVNLGVSLFMAFLGIVGLFFELKADSKSIMPTMKKK